MLAVYPRKAAARGIAIEADEHLHDRDRDRTARVVDDLLAAGTFLPLTSGEHVPACERGLLPQVTTCGGACRLLAPRPGR